MTKFIVYSSYRCEGGWLDEFDTLEEAIQHAREWHLGADDVKVFEVLREIEVKS